MKRSILLIAILFMTASVSAQYIEDGLRYSSHDKSITPRADALGVAYLGISDDIAASLYNPAGLALIDKSEISFGFGFDRNTTTTNMLGIENEFSSNDAFIDHIGLVSPFANNDRNAAIGLLYTQESNFDNNLDFSVFNPNSTYIGGITARNRGIYGNNPSQDDLGGVLPYQLWLANSQLQTVFEDSLRQSNFVQESGGLHNITGSMAFEVSDYVSIGFNISGKFGSYNYQRDYKEEDIENIYNANTPNIPGVVEEFSKLELEENLDQSVSGITGGIGVMAKLQNIFRFSAAIDFPTFYEVSENFSQNATAYLQPPQDDYPSDEGFSETPNYTSEGESTYNLTTPFVYKAGMSFHVMNMTFSAGVEYNDVTQLEFSDGPPGLDELNTEIVRKLVGQTKWGIGAEYYVPIFPLIARASYTSQTSPYVDDVAGATLNHFALGAGFVFGKNIRLDGVLKWTDVSYVRTNYGSSAGLTEGLNEGSLYSLDHSPLSIGLQFTYRY